jgi:3-dehydroquinate dehydratase/shikimate dehydrogenase
MCSSRRLIQTLARPDDAVHPGVDFVEARLDLYPDLDLASFLERARTPVVVTVRRTRDGGRFEGSESARAELFGPAKRAAWVDVELDSAPGLAPDGPRRVVSVHDLAAVPEDLDELFERCLLRGADVVKIAATPRTAAEALRLRALPTPGIGMGPFGAFTRVLAPWTYCANGPVAPGMPTPDELLGVFRVRRLGPAPALYGVAGDPIAHSRRPHLGNEAFERDGTDAVYVRFRVADLAGFWQDFRAHGGRALSITSPLKQQAAHLAGSPSAEVTRCGAANTLLADGRAFNTDYRAFLDLLPAGDGGRAMVLGAGGAARAAVLALRDRGYDVTVWSRTPVRARALGAPVAAAFGSAPVIVNTTPLDPPPADFTIDLRYGPGIVPPVPGVGGEAFLEAQFRHQYRLVTGDA